MIEEYEQNRVVNGGRDKLTQMRFSPAKTIPLQNLHNSLFSKKNYNQANEADPSNKEQLLSRKWAGSSTVSSHSITTQHCHFPDCLPSLSYLCPHTLDGRFSIACYVTVLARWMKQGNENWMQFTVQQSQMMQEAASIHFKVNCPRRKRYATSNKEEIGIKFGSGPTRPLFWAIKFPRSVAKISVIRHF